MAGEGNLTVERPRRWKRWLAVSVAVVVLVLLAALWQLPWLLGTGAGRSFVASKLSTEAMRFSIDSLDLSWSGDQAIGGLRISDAQQREVADVSAAFRGSLWSWARGSRDFGTVALSGAVTVYESEDSGGSTGSGGSTPAPGGSSEDLSKIVLPEGIKAALEIDSVTVKYVPLPGSSQPRMAVRDVKGKFAIDGRSPVTLNLVGATEVGSTIGAFRIAASLEDFAGANGALQPAIARAVVEISGENLPVPIIERMMGESGRLSALLGESVNLSINASGGMGGGDAALNATSPRASATLAATIDSQRQLTVTEGQATLSADQKTLEALLTVDQLAGLKLSQQATAKLHIEQFTAVLPTADAPLDLAKASFDATLSIEAVSVETGRDDVTAADLRNLAVHIISPNPTQQITLRSTAQLTSHVAGQPAPLSAPLEADITLVRALKADGALSRETLGLSGLIRTQSVPTALVDSLAGADGWIVDALGPTLTRVQLMAGTDERSPDATTIALTVSAPDAQASADLRLLDGRVQSIDGKPVSASITVRQALRDRLAATVAESSPQVQLNEAGRVTIQITSLSAELPSETDAGAWKRAALRGSLALQGARATYAPQPVEGETPASARIYDIDTFTVDWRTDSLNESVAADIKSALKQDSVPLVLDGQAQITGALDAATRTTQFETTETTLPLAIISAWAGEQTDVVTEALGGAVRLTLKAVQSPAALFADAKLRGERSDLVLAYSVQDERPRFELSGTQRATPALVAALLGPEPVAALAEPANLTFTLSTPAQAAAGAAFNDWPLKLAATAPRAVLTGISGIPGAVTTANLTLDVDWAAGLAGTGRYALTGDVTDDRAAIARLNADLNYTLGGDWTKSRGRIVAREINVTSLERTLALEPGLLSAWLGGSGGLEVGSVIGSGGELTDDLLVSAQFDRASGRLAGRLVEDRLVVNTPGTLAARIDRARMASLLNEWTGGAAPAAPGAQWAALEDANVGATVRSISLPLAALSGGEYDPRQLSIDADIQVPRLALKQGATDVSLTDTLLKLGGRNLAEGLTAQLKSTTAAGAGGQAGGIDLNGLVKAATSNPADRRYSVKGQMTGVPVAIVDAIAQMDGRLVAALGSAMDMRLDVSEAHANGGTLTAAITTPNGTLSIPRGELRDNTLIIESAAPLTASLEVTPEMSSTLLSNVNPLLYDVRKKAGPMGLNASRLVLPLDGDVSKLDGQFTLDLGQLYVPTQGLLGEFLGQLKPKTDSVETERVETLIPPITARIRNGVLQYDKFVMQSQAFEISSSGKVDLVNRKLDLLASVPLIGWKSVFADMTKIAPAFLTDIPLNVPFYLVVRGPIDKPEIKPDPKGAQRVADEFFKNIGGNLIDNVLDGVFKPKK